MKLAITAVDWQHVCLVLVGSLNSFGPAIVAAYASPGVLSHVINILGPIVAIATTILAVLKTSPVLQTATEVKSP